MRHKGFTVWEILAIVAILAIIAAILFPVFYSGRHEPSYRASCQSNLKQVGLGILVYTQDYNETFPRVELASAPNSSNQHYYGWADAIFPYIKSHQLFQCSLEENKTITADATQQNYTDYWMNSNLSDLKLEKLTFAGSTLLCGDGNDGTDATNARYNISALPKQWIDDKNSPAYRHVEGANYSFADGHVKWHKPQDIKATPVRKGGPTFAFR